MGGEKRTLIFYNRVCYTKPVLSNLRWDSALSLFCMSSSERGHVYQHTALLPTALSDM